jgi:hypothetical protein
LRQTISKVAINQYKRWQEHIEIAECLKSPEKFSYFHINGHGFLEEGSPKFGLITTGVQYCNVPVITLKLKDGMTRIYAWHIDHSLEATERFTKQMDELQKNNELPNAKIMICRRSLASSIGQSGTVGIEH